MSEESEEPKNFTVRFSPEAQFNAISISDMMPTVSSALKLYREFAETAGKLAYLPERHVVQEEASRQLGRTLRRLLIRRWNLFYEVLPETDDGPLVKVLFIRDSRLPPLTPEEAEQILANQ